jgi:hypothetical protein
LKDASEEAACAVCMEIMVEATAIVPCGHMFCKICVSSLSECPNCRSVVQRNIPLKGMDNIIHKLVLSGNVFCPHDVQQYWKRLQIEVRFTRLGVKYTRLGVILPPLLPPAHSHTASFLPFSHLLYSHLCNKGTLLTMPFALTRPTVGSCR